MMNDTHPSPPPTGRWRLLLGPETTQPELEALVEALVIENLEHLARLLVDDPDVSLVQRSRAIVRAEPMIRTTVRAELTKALAQLRH